VQHNAKHAIRKVLNLILDIFFKDAIRNFQTLGLDVSSMVDEQVFYKHNLCMGFLLLMYL